MTDEAPKLSEYLSEKGVKDNALLGRYELYFYDFNDIRLDDRLTSDAQDVDIGTEILCDEESTPEYFLRVSLVKEVAEQYGVFLTDNGREYIFRHSIRSKEDVDKLVNAVIEYDRILHSDEFDTLKKRFERIVDDDLVGLIQS